ncbi:MAG: HAMP domain-containing protein [Deltaproteobacteria bacterium]|nr:HAMP domain-containing protein [Deltaproteobacteria bacterium]
MFIKRYLTSFRGKLTALVTAAILLPMIISSILLGSMLEKQFRTSFENRLKAGLETFHLILGNKEKELVQGLSRMASDNTLQMTLELEIVPQLRKYLESHIDVLGFSTLIVFDAQKQLVTGTGRVFSEFIGAEGSKLVTDATDTLISHTEPIYRYNKLLGYVLGAFSLKESNFLEYIGEKLVDYYAVWADGELVTTDLGSKFLPTDLQLQAVGIAKDILAGKNDYRIMAKAVNFGDRRLSYGILLPLEELKKEFRTIVWIIGTVVVSLFTLILLLLRLFMREMVAPVTQLTKAALSIEKGKEIPWLDDRRTDEFGQMAVAFKRMVENLKGSEQELKTHRDHLKELVRERTVELEVTHRELVETARKVGMAEVATGVLHNVGNVLNSVGVITASMSKRIKESRVSYLSNLVNILEDHEKDLGAFFTKDDRGKRLPTFIAELSGNLADERKYLLKAVEKLSDHVRHIFEIVHLQQSCGKLSGLTEPVLINELVEDAVGINREALIRHEIDVRREYAHLPPVMFDRPKTLQILTNLISNAKFALSKNRHNNKILTLRIKAPKNKMVRIEVSDNGIGIAEEGMTRIFNYGFTTRKEGHGFGLHSGSLAAKEMGGSLTADSAGLGKGATFTLELPFNPEEIKNDR